MVQGQQIYGPVDLPFPVVLFGVTHRTAYFSSLGFISFEASLPSFLPGSGYSLWPSQTVATIAVGGDMAYGRTASRIELRRRGRLGQRSFTVSFVDFPMSSLPDRHYSGHATFEERTGDLRLSTEGVRAAFDEPGLLDSGWLGAFGRLGAPLQYFEAMSAPSSGQSYTLDLSDCNPRTHRDRDADTLVDACDPCPDDFDPSSADFDRDGFGDACDTNPGQLDAGFGGPVGDDPDGDGLRGDADNCRTTPNADQHDRDGDFLGDACDACPDGPWVDDWDGDGVCDPDNCISVFNPDQTDSDGDGLGDACDECDGPRDYPPEYVQGMSDGDGVCFDVDNCPSWPNADQADRDGDGLGDPCDYYIDLPEPPAESDGVPQDVDNCPDVANWDQADLDGDGLGDACDPDIDGDGVENAPLIDYGPTDTGDNCPVLANADQADADEDGIGDACDLGPYVVELLYVGEPGIQLWVQVNGQEGWFADLPADPEGPVRIPLPDWFDRLGAPGPNPAEGFCDQIRGAFLVNSDDYLVDLAWFAVERQTAEGAERTCLVDGLNNPNPTCTRLDPYSAPAGVVPLLPAGNYSMGTAWSTQDTDGLGQGVGPGCLPDNCPQSNNPDQADAVGDGLGDPCDVCPHIFDPTQPDADRDEIGDNCDNCPDAPNQNQADWDGDGIGDACDVCVSVPSNPPRDGDGDGWDTACDNCPALANPDQADFDHDRLGDACDVCAHNADPGAPDQDRDGIPNACDNCPKVANPAQIDADRDGRGDACDNCPAKFNADQKDRDHDARGDVCDNCPNKANPNQLDTDRDGRGDVCDAKPRVPGI